VNVLVKNMVGLVGYALEEEVAYITLNDGKVNVMSVDMMNEIDAALDLAETEAELIVLRSAAPGVFTAGFDLKILSANDAERTISMMKTGAELALRLLSYPLPTLGVMAGHAYPMGAFLLLACDFRIGVGGPHKIGLNEVSIGIVPPRFAIELARSRLHPAWLSRTVTLGEMFEPDAAVKAGFLDAVVAPEALEQELEGRIQMIRQSVHLPSHAAAKRRSRDSTITAMRQAIDEELTVTAFRKAAR